MTLSQARRLQVARRWHRRGALLVALWLAVLAITGSAINRAHDWGLDRAALPATMQGALYGIDPRTADPCAGLAPAPDACDRAFARLFTNTGSILLTPHSVLLLGPEGQLVEALPAGQLGLSRIDAGLADDEWVYLRGGQRTVAADPALFNNSAPSLTRIRTSWRRFRNRTGRGRTTPPRPVPLPGSVCCSTCMPHAFSGRPRAGLRT